MKKERPYVSSAVEGGKIRFLSISQIKLFDPRSDGCHRRWFFSYVLRKKLAKTGSQDFGIDRAEKLEHYLTTGEDVLPPELQEAKRFFPAPGSDLECERPLGDLKAALERSQAALAGLTACGVPLDGAADFRHQRGVYVDPDGHLQKEHSSTRVVEIGDLKTTVRIDARRLRDGKILPGYAKTHAQVCEDTQMVGYGRHAIDHYPGITHVRLSHVYAQTGSKGAAKRTGLISVQQVLDRWHGGVEPVVAQMIQVARAERVEDVQPTVASCDAFTHIDPDGKTAKGCGHRYYCPLGQELVAQSILHTLGGGDHTTNKEPCMSLFEQFAPGLLSPGASAVPTVVPTAPAPAPPPPTPEQHRAAVDAEKARLQAEDRGQAPLRPPAIGRCGTPGCGIGCAEGWIKSPAGPGAFIQCQRCAAGYVAPRKPDPVSPTAVTPPDAPPPAPLQQAADPLPLVALADVKDPTLRQTIENHAAVAAQQQLAMQAQEMKMSDSKWCAGSKQVVPITTQIAMAKNKWKCPQCGKELKLEPMEQTPGNFIAVTKNHRNEALAATAPPPPPSMTAAAVSVAAEMAPPPPPPPATNGTNGSTNGTNGHTLNTGFAQITTVELLKSMDGSLKEIASLLRSRA